MKERPILFKTEMVQAVLSGKKTQIRRVVKYIPALGDAEDWCHKRNKRSLILGDYTRYCPYGMPGDRLWVREAWSAPAWYDKNKPSEIPRDAKILYKSFQDPDADTIYDYERWRPSIHMPRWMSRITLTIKSVRIDRLHYITAEDALSEGIFHNPINCPRSEFAWLWDSINEKNGVGWYTNPYVWVVEFEKKVIEVSE